MKKNTTKEELRKEIAILKKTYSAEDLLNMSDEVFSVLEITGNFQEAKNIFIYNSLSDEVSTPSFIQKWKDKKNFFLPAIESDEIVFRPYQENEDYKTSELGIKEPQGANFVNFDKVDMIIVPGVAFDRKMNRMGRGKGYYDRFLPKLKATKVGICFDFQLFSDIPCNSNDIKMDMLISENDLIW